MLREEPETYEEQVAYDCVLHGWRDDVEEEIQWNGPTKEPFLTLWSEGWRKWKARHTWASGLVIVIHFWKSPSGERAHLKFKNEVGQTT